MFVCIEMRIFSLFTNEKNVTEKSVHFSVTVVTEIIDSLEMDWKRIT